MKREEIIRMAEEAGAKFDPHWGIAYNCGNETFIRFAALVAAAERERCCLAIYDATDNMHDEQDHVMKEMHCDAIRALES